MRKIERKRDEERTNSRLLDRQETFNQLVAAVRYASGAILWSARIPVNLALSPSVSDPEGTTTPRTRPYGDPDMRTVLALLLLTGSLAAQEFTTDAAKAAKAKYEATLAAAREQYVADLNEAAKVAVEAGELDEVGRIAEEKTSIATQETSTEVDALDRARKSLEGSVWSWVSQKSGSKRLYLFEDSKAAISNKTTLSAKAPEASSGMAWQMLEPRVLLMKADSSMWLLRFNAETDRFDVRLYTNQKHYIKPGNFVSGPQ